MTDEAPAETVHLVVNMTPERGRRNWLRPKLYILPTESGEMAWRSPWPFEMEWKPEGEPDRRCVRCGYLHPPGDGSVYHDPDGVHCPACHELLHPYVPVKHSKLRLWWWRWHWRLWGRWVSTERIDAAYLAWCRRFGTEVWQEEPPRP